MIADTRDTADPAAPSWDSADWAEPLHELCDWLREREYEGVPEVAFVLWADNPIADQFVAECSAGSDVFSLLVGLGRWMDRRPRTQTFPDTDLPQIINRIAGVVQRLWREPRLTFVLGYQMLGLPAYFVASDATLTTDAITEMLTYIGRTATVVNDPELCNEEFIANHVYHPPECE